MRRFKRLVVLSWAGWMIFGCQRQTHSGGDEQDRPQGAAPALGVLGDAKSPPRLLAKGDTSPDFLALAHTGAKVHLYDLIEKPLLLVFYDKNGSASMEQVFGGLADAWLQLQPRIGLVLAIGAHDTVQQAAYATDKQWPFMFLADADRGLARAYGVTATKAPVVAVLIGGDKHVLWARSVDTATDIVGALERALSSPAPAAASAPAR